MTREKCFDCRAWWMILPGILLALACLAEARGAPPPSDYAKAGLADAGVEDEARAQVDAGIPVDDGLGTSPSLSGPISLGDGLDWDEWLFIGLAGWTLISAIVAATPTQKDDEALSRVRAVFERVSFLKPANVPGFWSVPGVRSKPDGPA